MSIYRTLYVGFSEFRTPESVFHNKLTRFLEKIIPDIECGTKRLPAIIGSTGRDENILIGCMPINLAIDYGIHGNATSQAQIVTGILFVEFIQEMNDDFPL